MSFSQEKSLQYGGQPSDRALSSVLKASGLVVVVIIKHLCGSTFHIAAMWTVRWEHSPLEDFCCGVLFEHPGGGDPQSLMHSQECWCYTTQFPHFLLSARGRCRGVCSDHRVCKRMSPSCTPKSVEQIARENRLKWGVRLEGGWGSGLKIVRSSRLWTVDC